MKPLSRLVCLATTAPPCIRTSLGNTRDLSARRLVLMVGFFVALVAPVFAQDVLTSRYDNARSGHQAAEAILSPASVNYSKFGKVLSFAVDGDVYAQPLYVSQYQMADGTRHNVLFVATQQDSLYAFDADGNNPSTGYLWRDSLLGAGETWLTATDVGTDDITPSIGITGTPVIDRVGGILYVVSKSKAATGGNLSGVVQRLHALNLADGSERLNGPTVIRASIPGTGEGGTVISFNPLTENQRPGLTLAPSPGSASANALYIAWASHGDLGTYHGWVIGYNAADISQETGAWSNTPDGSQGGIWMSANGLAVDNNGIIFAAAGNGSLNANSGGRNYGSGLVKLSNASSGITVQDWLAPDDTFSLNATDSDFGTAGPVLLPDQPGANPHLLVTSDKSGKLYLVNRDNLGHFNGSYNADLQEWKNGGYTIHSNFAWFNNYLYLAPDGGPVQAYPFNVATQLFGTSPQTQSHVLFGGNQTDGSGSNLVISSNGTQNAVVWAIDYHAYRFGPLVLHAFDAANLATELYNSNQAAQNRDVGPIAVKFASPTVANGRVYVGGRNAVVAYGPLQTVSPTTLAPSFSVAGGTYPSAQVVSLNDATPGASIFYTTDGSAPSTNSHVYSAPINIPVTTTLQAIALAPGDALSPLSTVTYVISSGTPPPPTTISFTNGFTAGSVQLNGSATLNGSRLRLTDGNTYETASSFFPTPVNIQAFTSDFSFQLSNPGADGITLAIQNTGKSALGSFGINLGYAGIPQSVAVKFDLYNNAGEGVNSTGLYLNGASPVTPSTDLTPSGVDLHSGHTMAVHAAYSAGVLGITITDTVTGKSAQQQYTVNIPAIVGNSTAYVGFTGGTGGLSAVQEILTWTLTSQAVVTNPGLPTYPNGFAGSQLALNGGPSINGTRLRLTDGGSTEARSAFYPTAVDIQKFTSSFTFQITNPNADGFTFNIQRAGPTAVGPSGGGLGYGSDTPTGAPGIPNSLAVKFDLYNNNSEGSDSTGLYLNGASPTTPSTDLTSSGVNLHSGNVLAATIGYDGTTLSVTVKDTVTGATATQTYTINVPATIGGTSAYVGFTAGTGGLSANQEILTWVFTGQAAIIPPPPPPPPPSNAKLTITSPTNGQTISGVFNFTAQITVTLDPAGSYLIVDGKAFGKRVSSPPYVYPADTRLLSNGSHTVQLWGHDTGNENLLSAPITVVVAN